MSVFGRFTLNGWQRLWLICVVVLFFPMVLLVDDRDNFSKRLGLTTEMSREFEVSAIKERDNPTCIKLLEAIKSKQKAGWEVYYDFEKEAGKENPCTSIGASIKNHSELKSKEELVKSLEDFDKRQSRLTRFHIFLWVLVSAGLYGLGLLGRWVKRGGWGSRPDET
jgi:hypothetical protein